jgi:hypothetical protein
MIALDQGNYTQADAYLVTSLTDLRELNEHWQILNTLEVFAGLAAAQGQPYLLRSARIFGAVDAQREMISMPTLAFERQFVERSIAILYAQLDEAALASAWAEGRAMTMDQVVAYALERTPKKPHLAGSSVSS